MAICGNRAKQAAHRKRAQNPARRGRMAPRHAMIALGIEEKRAEDHRCAFHGSFLMSIRDQPRLLDSSWVSLAAIRADTGHFALETHCAEIDAAIREFLDRPLTN